MIIDYIRLDQALKFQCDTGKEHPYIKRKPNFRDLTMEVGQRYPVLVGQNFQIEVNAPLPRRFFLTREPGQPLTHGTALKCVKTSVGYVPENRGSTLHVVDENRASFKAEKPGLYVITWYPGGGLCRDIHLVALEANHYRTLAPWGHEDPFVHHLSARNIINSQDVTLASLILGLEDPEFQHSHDRVFPFIFGDCTRGINLNNFGCPGYVGEDEQEIQQRQAREAAQERMRIAREQEEQKVRQEQQRQAKFKALQG